MPADTKDTKPKSAERLAEGPLDPTVRAARQVAHRPDDGQAFLPDPSTLPDRHVRLTEDAAEAFGEEFVAAVTGGGEDVATDALDELAEDEDGGPFLVLATDEDFPSQPDVPVFDADAEAAAAGESRADDREHDGDREPLTPRVFTPRMLRRARPST